MTEADNTSTVESNPKPTSAIDEAATPDTIATTASTGFHAIVAHANPSAMRWRRRRSGSADSSRTCTRRDCPLQAAAGHPIPGTERRGREIGRYGVSPTGTSAIPLGPLRRSFMGQHPSLGIPLVCSRFGTVCTSQGPCGRCRRPNVDYLATDRGSAFGRRRQVGSQRGSGSDGIGRSSRCRHRPGSSLVM
jgi:hypothetical protein